MKAFFRHRLLFIGGLLAVAAVGLGVVTPVLAEQTNQYITLTPSSAELSLAPGKSIDGQVAIVNQGSGAFDVALSTAPYHVAPDDVTYDPQFEPLDGKVNASQWVSLQTDSKQNIKPNDVVDVKYTVSVPASTAPGGYYAVVFAETTPTNMPEGGVVAHNRVGQILYITVEGAVQESGELENNDVTAFTVGTNVNSSSIIKNTGGKHFKTAYTTTVHSLFGKEVFTETKDAYVLPQTKRKVAANWNTSALVGIYKVSRSATLPSGTVTLPDVWVFTVQPVVVFILLGGIIIGGALLVLKRRKA